MVEVDCYPIGVIRMIDDDEIDDKIIAIPFEDPNWNYYHDIDQLPPHHGNEIAHFFEIYKSLEHKYTATLLDYRSHILTLYYSINYNDFGSVLYP